MAKEKTPEELEKAAEIKARKNAQREQFKLTGLDSMSEKEILSLFLGCSMGIKDCFEAADDLLMRFGSFRNIFDASLDSLLDLPYINGNAAFLIKGVPELCRRMLIEKRPKNKKIKTPDDAKEYLYPYFLGYNMEIAYLLLINKRYVPIKAVLLAKGGGQSVYLSAELIVREVLMGGASACVLAHSHPGGYAKPSVEDEIATLKISADLSKFGITMLDHLIFSKNDCCFMSDNKNFNSSVLAFAGKK
ncbi:MAG: hypothetical protein J1E34_08305 [Oscillospiraceae bacterium]|nr:hypothetical protein [Oscillospiraceae bacterium]